MIEGVHFLPGEDAGAIGWKALAVNVSDLVAKGAEPLAYLMSIALPAPPDPLGSASSPQGLRNAQEAFGCHLAGGDTDRTPGPLSVSITAFGCVPSGAMVRRSTAQAGDHVYVSGTIGDATLGLALARDPGVARALRPRRRGCAMRSTGRFSRPQPPVALAPVLRACASAAMDISDGLIEGLRAPVPRIGRGRPHRGGARAALAAARAVLAAGGATLGDLADGRRGLRGSGDRPGSTRAADFERAAQRGGGVRVTCIGSITGSRTWRLCHRRRAARRMVFTKTGWDHFHSRRLRLEL